MVEGAALHLQHLQEPTKWDECLVQAFQHGGRAAVDQGLTGVEVAVLYRMQRPLFDMHSGYLATRVRSRFGWEA